LVDPSVPLRGSAGAACFPLAASMATFKDVGFEDLCFLRPVLSKTNDSTPVLTLKSSHWFCVKRSLTLLIRGRVIGDPQPAGRFMIGAPQLLAAPQD
jgi:hypothetical protein